MIQEFLIKGCAIPASRPRTAPNRHTAKGFIVYKCSSDKEWQASVLRQVQANKHYCFERGVPVKFIFFAFYKKPKSAQYDTAISHSIGDCDNISKNLQDALQSRTVKVGKLKIKQKGLCFEDDSQITDLICRKRYSADGTEFVIIRVTDELDNKECEWL